MNPNLSLPAFGALILAAAAFGVHLGQSTVDQINPIHFQGPAVHPRDRGAVVYETAAPQEMQFSQLYGREEGAEARSADCGGCDALDARDRYAGGEVVFAVLETGWGDRAAEPAAYEPPLEAVPEEEPSIFADESAEIERYADFAIESKPDQYAAFQE